jgi:hypothetical protein
MTGTRNAITRTNTTINGESVGIVHVALSPILRCILVSLPDHEMPLHEQSRSSRREVILNACFTGQVLMFGRSGNRAEPRASLVSYIFSSFI